MTEQTDKKSEPNKENAAPLSEEDAVPAPDAEASGHADSDAPAAEDPRDARIAALEAELAKMKDAALRALADAENARKRAEKTVADVNKYGIATLARDMLSVADNLHRALDAVPQAEAANNEALANLRAGVEMTARELQTVLERHKIARVHPLGEKFDHNLHQAVFEVETEEHPPGHVAQVAQAGYVLHDRLLRPAMVGVAKKPANNNDGEKQA